MNKTILILAFTIIASCNTEKKKIVKKEPTKSWALTPFVKVDSINPILLPKTKSEFLCPIRKSIVYWESKDVFNPAAIVKDNKVFMLYRAEDLIGKHKGTSRLGLAVSEDGLHFTRLPKPVFYPDNDNMKKFEWEGGCEDPRIVEGENGLYVLTYTAWDGDKARLLIATSKDLLKWKKYGSAFKNYINGKYENIWSKSGSIVCKEVDGRMLATRINGKYWMYFGDTNIFLAYSNDLINWIPLEKDIQSNLENSKINENDIIKNLITVLKTRENRFDNSIVEPGPPAILTDEGILLIYNSRYMSVPGGNTNLSSGTYAAGQVLFDKNNPSKVIDRLDSTFFKPDKPYEINGQINNVCFLEGMVYFKGKWFIYYGTADSKIAVAVKE